jgi:hypothetical protein
MGVCKIRVADILLMPIIIIIIIIIVVIIIIIIPTSWVGSSTWRC